MGKIKKEKRELLQLELVPNTSIKHRKKAKRRERQELLLKEVFGHQTGDFYEEKRVDGKWYVKMYDGNNDWWQVAIYSNESFRRYKQFSTGDLEWLGL